MRERQIAFAIGFAATKAFEEPDCIADASPEAEVGKHNQQEFPTGFGECKFLFAKLYKPIRIIISIKMTVMAQMILPILLDGGKNRIHAEQIGDKVIESPILQKSKVSGIMHQDRQSMHAGTDDENSQDVEKRIEKGIADIDRRCNHNPIEGDSRDMAQGPGFIQGLEGGFVYLQIEVYRIVVGHSNVFVLLMVQG